MYNTLSPVPSKAVKDLSDNTEVLDRFMNSPSPSEPDRFFVRKETLTGLRKMVKDFLESMGFEAIHLTYVNGSPLVVNRPTQLIDRAGITYAVKQPATFPLILSGTWATDSSLLVDVGDNSLRQDLAAPTGSSMVGNLAQSLDKKFKEVVSIQDYGGGESVADNLTAFNAAKAALAPGGRMRFPKLSTGVYLWPTAGPNLSGIIIDPDPGVTFSGAIFAGMFASSIITTTDYVYRVTAGNPKDYDLEIKADFTRGSKRNSKQLWLTESDIKNRRPMPIIAYGAGAQLLYKRMTIGADAITTFTPAGGGADSLSLTPPNGGVAQLGVYPLRPGCAISAGVNVPPSGAGEIAVGVIWSTGYCVLRGHPETAIWELSTKYNGVAGTSQVQPAISNTAGYHPDCPIITIRFITSIRFQILISGSVITDFQLTSGYLMLAGFGITGIGSGSSINLVGWYTEKFKVADSPRPRTLGFLGDSMTDDLHGAWPWWTANALDGSFGIRVNGIENRAISGQTTAQQYNNIVANPFVKASDIVVFLGTNDVQTANSYASFLAAYTAILVLMKSQGRSITLVIFPTWYTQAQSGGGGGATQNPGKGGDMRAAIGRFAADNGFNLVDLTHVTGPVDAAFLTSTFTDPMVRDNLHPTTYLYKLVGYESAKAIAETACPVAVPDTPWTLLHSSVYPATFTGTLAFRFIDGDIELRGDVTAPAAFADGTNAFNIPEFLVPSATRRANIFGASASTSGFVALSTTAIVKGVSTSTTVNFDGVRYTV